MTKETLKTLWRSGDDSAAARLIQTKHGISVTKWALAAWRKRANNRSPLGPLYLAAYRDIFEQRKSANDE